MRSSLSSATAGISVFVCAIPLAIAIMRCRAPGGIEGVQRLALRVDADVRVVLQHAARQVAADGFEHVIGHADLGQLGDDSVAQIVEPEAWQARGITERSARRCSPTTEGISTPAAVSRS